MTSYKCHWMAKAGKLAESSVNFKDGRQKCQTVTGHLEDNDNRAWNVSDQRQTKTVLY